MARRKAHRPTQDAAVPEKRKPNRGSFGPHNPPPALLQGGVRRWTTEETEEQLRIVEVARREGETHQAVRKLLKQQGYVGIGMKRVQFLVTRVEQRWQDEFKNKRAVWKHEQILRLHTMRKLASGRRNPDGTWAEKPNHTAVARYEELLAKIEGTFAPIEIDLDVRYTEAMMLAIGSMDPETMARMLKEAEALDAHARKYVAEHPELTAAAE